MDKYLLTHEQMMAEIWDLGFGLEGMEGRLPTQKERFERIAKAQHAKAVEMVFCRIERDIGTTKYWQSLKAEILKEVEVSDG